MAIANVHETLILYTMEKADITNRLSTIMGRLTLASSQNLQLTEETNASRSALANQVALNPDYEDTAEYKLKETAVNNDYELRLAEINQWESELEQEKNSLETQLNVITSFQDSWNEVLKSNIKRDFNYFSKSN